MVTNGKILTSVFKNADYSEALKESTLYNAGRIYSKIPSPTNNCASNVGLVVGRVQSGKTANIITLSGLALDNGHKLVVLFLSDTNNLLTQNTGRFLDSFDNIDDVVVVKKSQDGDFDTKLDKDTLTYLHDENKKLLICSLKHAKHIGEINELISQSPYKDEYALIIDDEGDDIGLNTKHIKQRYIEKDGSLREEGRSATNAAIVGLKSSLKKLGYISLTATPEANILLQDFQELAPDYCITLEPGKGYTGLIRFHGEDSTLIEEIDDYDDLLEENGLPKSLAEAFAFFIAGCIIRKSREKGSFKHAMMIHPDHKIYNHQTVYDKMALYTDKVKDAVKINKQSGLLFVQQVSAYVNQIDPNLNVDIKNVDQVLKGLKLHLVNSESASNDLKNAMKLMPYHIVIGGNMLDRGITIDGLAVSYMTRMSKKGQVDTLLQRARWFGYKESYIDVCKVYMPAELIQQFSDLIEAEESVWQFLYECDQHNLSPKNQVPLLQIPKSLNVASKAKASYVMTNLASFVRTQSTIVNSKAKNADNTTLVNSLEWSKATECKYNAAQVHRKLTMDRKQFKDWINQYYFSERDELMSSKYICQILNEIPSVNVDVIDMRYQIGEKRSSEGFKIKALLQGRSEGKLPTDPDYYVGDRYLQSDNLIVQIHHVILKNSVGNMYKAGDTVIQLAMLFPDGYVGGQSVRRMSVEDLKGKLK